MAEPLIVEDVLVHWQQMDGDTRIVKQINAMLTATFIMRREMPSDECLSEAVVLPGLQAIVPVGQWEQRVKWFLMERFARGTAASTGEEVNFPEVEPDCERAAEMAFSIIEAEVPLDLVALMEKH